MNQHKQLPTVILSHKVKVRNQNLPLLLGIIAPINIIHSNFRPSRHRKQNATQRPHILPLQLLQSLSRLKLQNIHNPHTINPQSYPRQTKRSRIRLDGTTTPPLLRTQNMIQLQCPHGKITPMHSSNGRYQLSQTTPNKRFGEWYPILTTGSVEKSFFQRDCSRVIIVNEEYSSLTDEAFVPSDYAWVVEAAGGGGGGFVSSGGVG
mmetsp:Transcript_24875/g.37562  ORF Transcript_24875/g.37562 Transcript_24875/m.37562 type:complete len:206 (-) Transcript_24875:783-1400(-)